MSGVVCGRWLTGATTDNADSDLVLRYEQPASFSRSSTKKGRKKKKRGSDGKEIGVLERAERWAAMLDGDHVKTRADLARHLGVSRARVTQALNVLTVPGPVMERLRRAEEAKRPVMERTWRAIRGRPVEDALALLRERGFE